MTARTQVILRVELDSQGDSISGRVLEEDGAGRSFSGWVGLAAAIEAASASSAQHVDRPYEEESRQCDGANHAEVGGNAPPTITRQQQLEKGQEER